LTYTQQKYLSKPQPWYSHSRVKNVQKKVGKVGKKAKQSLNQPPPITTPYNHSATANFIAHSILFLVYKWNSVLN